MTDETRGQQIRRRRKALGLTQTDLALSAGVSESTIRNLEKDTREQTHTARGVLEALTRHEAGQFPQDIPARSAEIAKLERILGEDEVTEMRMVTLAPGVTYMTIVVKSADVTDEELREAMKRARPEPPA